MRLGEVLTPAAKRGGRSFGSFRQDSQDGQDEDESDAEAMKAHPVNPVHPVKTPWPTVRLGEVLRQRRPEITVEQTESYQFAGVYCFGRGVFRGQERNGNEFAYPTLSRLRAGEFVYPKLMAWEGAFGVVPANCDGCYVSPEFPVFEIDGKRLDSRFLSFYFKIPRVWESVSGGSTGTNIRRRRLNPADFIQREIPLPPLAEQRRVVARIEELSAQIHEARTIRRQAAEETKTLSNNRAGQVFSNLETKYTPREFGSFAPHVTSGPRNWATHYEQNGFRFYRAQDVGADGTILDGSKVFITPPDGEQGRTALLQRGDLMLVITGATVGRVSIYRKGLQPGFVSQHVGICRLPHNEVDPEFALWGLRAPNGQAQLLGQRYGQGKPGLNLSNIRSLALPFPPLPEQRRIVAELDALQAEVDALKRLQAGTAAELDALLPALLDRAFKGEL